MITVLTLTKLRVAYGALLDVVLALMPITIIWKVKLSLKKKLGLCILLGLGMR